MSDEVKAEGSQEPPKPPTPQAGQTAPEPAPPVGRTLDADALAKELDETRKEAAKYRTERKTLADEMKALQAKLTALETASLSEQEKKDKEYQRAQEQAAALAAQLAETTKRNQELQARAIVQAAAGRLGVVDPDAAYVLLRDNAGVEPDEHGALDAKKIEAALRELLKAKPYLMGVPQTSAANPAKSDPTVTRESDEQRRARLHGGGYNIFDADNARKRGGGVVWGGRDVGS